MQAKPLTISKQTKALMLFLRLNQQAGAYTPLSHHGRRAKRLMPAIRAKYLIRAA